ncbi:hypothetical protein [Curtobacterium sp. MCBA15_008]|uniref:hypothetical protein n=1 Tax=Curtobacterium sp. MCBA15_008 TaxID=1898736 RepID=UPI001113D4B4|nr:hypothetical protein [Curtobacterium sp. MCBA15_008]
MRSGVLGLDIDAYGAEGQAAALADFMEAAALRRQSVTFSGLEEAIKDHGWGEIDNGLFITGDEQMDRAMQWPDRVRSLIMQRASILGANYPFRIRANALQLKARHTRKHSSYERLLILTIAHSWGYSGKPRPDVLFERLVVGALKNAGFRSAGIGTGTRASKRFENALAEAGRQVGISTMSSPSPVRRSAKDEKVDVLSVVNWRDPRPGRISLITQATVGKSGSWMRKLKEPEPPKWKNYLLEKMAPLSALAVPHHVDDRHLTDLLAVERGTVLDRLRLAPLLGEVVDGEPDMRAWFDRLDIEL